MSTPEQALLNSPEASARSRSGNHSATTFTPAGQLPASPMPSNLPLLRKQNGFRDELALVAPNGSEVLAISLWDQKDNAEAYHRTTYPEIQKLLAKVTEGTPQVQTYEVSTSTSHQAAARAVTG